MNDENEDALLVETGKLVTRLLHDFKNQIGGMKLYVSYLKKRFGSDPNLAEGVEIADKISQGLNEMAEQAVLVGRLTRPIELRRERGDPGTCLELAVNGLKPQAAAKGVTLSAEIALARPALSLDLQQMQAALAAFVARAVESTPAGGTVRVRLDAADDAVRIEVADEGERPDDRRLAAFFDPVTNERISRTSLGLALARRVIALHKGEVTARAATGAVIEVKLKP